MKPFSKGAQAVALCMLCANAGAGARRSLTLDDVLRVENIGQATIAHHERAAVYEWIAPYEQAPNLEMPVEAGDAGPHAKLYVVDIGSAGVPRPLFPQEPAGSYWIGALSPDSTRLAIYSLVSRTFRAGVFDFESGRLAWFDFVPNYHPSYLQHPLWISNEELVYSMMPAGARPAVMYRYAMAARMSDLWEKTFRGREPSVTVHVSTPSGIEDPDPFEPATLVRVDARTGHTIELDRGYHASLRLSSDGRYLAALRLGGQLRPRDASLTVFGKRLQPVVFDLQAGSQKIVPCEDCHVMPSNLWWSADERPGSQRLAFRAFHTRTEQFAIHQYRPSARSLDTVDVRGLWLSCWIPVLPSGPGDAVTLFAQPLADPGEFRPWIPSCRRPARQDWFVKTGNGDFINLSAAIGEVGETPVGLTPKGPLIVTPRGESWLLDASGKARRLQLAQGIDSPVIPWEPLSMSATRAGSELPARHVVLQTSKQVIHYDLQALRGSRIPRPSADSNLLAMSPRAALFREDRPNGVSRLLIARASSRPREILVFNEHLQDVQLGRQTRIPFEVRGEPLSGCAVLPPDWSPQRRYPLIVDVYPGGDSGDAICHGIDFRTANNFQLFAAEGYVVLYPPAPNRLIRTAEGPTRELTAIALAAVDAAIAQGYADPARLGVYGMSQGFHSALQVISETERFKAAIAANGISDFASHYGSAPPEALSQPFGGSVLTNAFSNAARYESADGDNGLGVAPWVNVRRYTSNSPVFRADRITTPLLLLYGDLDGFGMAQATEMFSALHRLRREAQYAIYWGEGHGNFSPANIRDVWRRMLEWYGQRLKTDLPPTSGVGDRSVQPGLSIKAPSTQTASRLAGSRTGDSTWCPGPCPSP